jgi:type IV pilus assembly protein PilO
LEQLLDRILKLRVEFKILGLAVAILLLTALNYFVWVSDLNDEAARQDAQIQKLENDLIQKQAIANNLAEYRRQKEILEHKLQEALTELPNDANIDELLTQLNETGVRAGLNLTSVEPGAELKEGGFYSKIPVKLTLSGNYHEVATFFDLVGKLKRIVNISDIALKSPEKKGDKVVLKVDCLATTFRFVDAKPPAAKAAPGAPTAAGAAPPVVAPGAAAPPAVAPGAAAPTAVSPGAAAPAPVGGAK